MIERWRIRWVMNGVKFFPDGMGGAYVIYPTSMSKRRRKAARKIMQDLLTED